MNSRRLGLVTLVVVGLGFGSLALASAGGFTGQRQVVRPLEVHPEPEAPSSSFLALQEQAVPQPRGEHRPGVTPVVPRIASPQR